MKSISQVEVVLGSVKWSDMFDSEEELTECLKSIDVEEYKKDLRKGYVFVEGFQKTLAENRELSPKQMTQLKRIAKEVYRYIHKF